MKILVLLALTSVTLGAPPTGPEIIYADLNHPPSRETNNLPRAPDSQYASIKEISPQGSNNNPQVSGSEYASIDDLGLHGSDAIYDQPLTGENALRAITAAGKTPVELYLYGRKVSLQTMLGYKGVETMDSKTARRKYGLLGRYSNNRIPAVFDSNPSETNLRVKCDGIEYINRDFAVSFLDGDTPTVMAKDMLMSNRKFVVIVGEKGSGKTVALTKMLNVHRASSANTWSIIVDVDMIPADSLTHMTPGEIITNGMSQEHAEIFLKVLETNPAKVNILVDNVDKLPAETRTKFLDHLESLSEKRTGVAVTSSPDLGWELGQTATQTVVEIPGLNSVEIEQYLARHSEKELGLKTSEKHADYAKAVAKALEGDAIPKDLRTMRELKALLINGDRNVFSGEKKFVSVREYAAGETSNPREVLKMLEEVKINKLRLMEKLTASSVPADLAREYGIRALESVLSPESRQSPSHSEIKQLRASHQSSSTKHPMDFIKSDSLGREVFVHPEYERYFAAQYLTEQLRTNPSAVLETTKIVLQNPEYAGMAEYLNAAMKHAPESFTSVFQSIALQDTSIYATLDNAIPHGFDEIASAVLKTKNSATTVFKYFETAQKAPPTKMESKFHNKLGMLTTGDVIVADNKQEMVFRKNMDKTVSTLNDIQFERNANPKAIWHFDELPKYLEEIVLAQSQPNMETYEIVKKYIPPEKFTPEFADRLVQTAVNHECMDIRLYNDLIKLGATPSKINVKGEKLVHTAVKNLNPKLLKFVINELKVAVPVAPELLNVAFDANPLGRFSAPEFWRTMEILVEEGIRTPGRGGKKYTPTAAEMASPEYKLFTGEVDPASRIVTELRLSSATLDNMSPGLKSARRIAVLSNIGEKWRNTPATLTETLLSYRGVDKLSPTEQAAFEQCIIKAMESDINRKLSDRQKGRIVERLADTVGVESDVKSVLKLAEKINAQDMILTRIKSRYGDSESSPLDHSFDAELLRTNAELHPKLSQSRPQVALPIIDHEFAGIFKQIDGKPWIDNEKFQTMAKGLEVTDFAKYEKLMNARAGWLNRGAEEFFPSKAEPIYGNLADTLGNSEPLYENINVDKLASGLDNLDIEGASNEYCIL